MGCSRSQVVRIERLTRLLDRQMNVVFFEEQTAIRDEIIRLYWKAVAKEGGKTRYGWGFRRQPAGIYLVM